MPLPKFEDWKAPWEKGEGEEFDPEKGRKFLYSLLQREEAALAKADAAEASKTEAEQARAALQTKLDEQTAAGGPQIEALQRQVTEKAAEIEQLKEEAAAKSSRQELLFEVGLQLGLKPKQVKRLEGDTKEDLLADAEETFGVSGKTGEEEEPTPAPRMRPRSNLRNPGDPAPDEQPFDRAKALDLIPRP